MEVMEQATRGARKRTSPRAGTGDGTRRVAEPKDLFLSELADVYYAEKALEKVLPKLAQESTDSTLAKGFEQHLEQTRKHATNVEQVFEALGKRPQAQPCPGIEGIKQEHDEFMAEHDATPTMTDLFLAGAAARAEHYEIAAYTGLITMSRTLGDTRITKLLQENLRDEQAALRKVEAASKRLSNGRNGGRARSRSSSRARAGAKRTARSKRARS
jgi:ferritin-like metal-binding protein YciE